MLWPQKGLETSLSSHNITYNIFSIYLIFSTDDTKHDHELIAILESMLHLKNQV